MVDAEHGWRGETLLLQEVGLGGAGEIEDAEAAAFDLEAGGDGDVEGVELNGRVEAVAESGRRRCCGGWGRGGERRTRAVMMKAMSSAAERDAERRQPAIARAVRAVGLGVSGWRARDWQCLCSSLIRCEV